LALTVVQGIAEGTINPIDKTTLRGPVNQRTNHFVKHTYVGKENRPVSATVSRQDRRIVFVLPPTE